MDGYQRYALQLQDATAVKWLGSIHVKLARKFVSDSLTIATKQKDDKRVNPRDNRLSGRRWKSLRQSQANLNGEAFVNVSNKQTSKLWKTLHDSQQGARFVLLEDHDDDLIAIFPMDEPGKFELVVQHFPEPAMLPCQERREYKASQKARRSSATSIAPGFGLNQGYTGRRTSEDVHGRELSGPIVKRAKDEKVRYLSPSRSETVSIHSDTGNDSAVAVSPELGDSPLPSRQSSNSSLLIDPRRRAVMGTSGSRRLTSTSATPQVRTQPLVPTSSTARTTSSTSSGTTHTISRTTSNTDVSLPPPPPRMPSKPPPLRTMQPRGSVDAKRHYTPYKEIGYTKLTDTCRPAYQTLEAYGDLVHNAAAANAEVVTISKLPQCRWHTLQVADDGVGLTCEQLNYMTKFGAYEDALPFEVAGRASRHYRSPCVTLARHTLAVTTIHEDGGKRVPNMFGILFMSRDLGGKACGHVASYTWVSSDAIPMSPAVAELLQHCQERADVGSRHILSWLQDHRQKQGMLILLSNIQMFGDARGGPAAKHLNFHLKSDDVRVVWKGGKRHRPYQRKWLDGMSPTVPLPVDNSLRAYLELLFLDLVTGVKSDGHVIVLDIVLFGKRVERRELRSELEDMVVREFVVADKGLWDQVTIDVVGGHSPTMGEWGIGGVFVYSGGRLVHLGGGLSCQAEGVAVGDVALVNVPSSEYSMPKRGYHRGYWFGLAQTDTNLRRLLGIVGHWLAEDQLEKLLTLPKSLRSAVSRSLTGEHKAYLVGCGASKAYGE
eukprot:m.132983 g.132983  ORF g.132983 m.132983 type:complete len:774 (-) comp15939_c0_seq1:75-2396(-)